MAGGKKQFVPAHTEFVARWQVRPRMGRDVAWGSNIHAQHAPKGFLAAGQGYRRFLTQGGEHASYCLGVTWAGVAEFERFQELLAERAAGNGAKRGLTSGSGFNQRGNQGRQGLYCVLLHAFKAIM